MKKNNPRALLPIVVFLVLYLGLGILFEYVMAIPMGFYNIPIVTAFLAAILTACIQNRQRAREEASMYGKIWPGPLVRVLMHFYKKAYKAYEE